MAAASTPSSVNSSIDSMRMSAENALGGATAGAKNVNFLSQLEHMMSSVKKEAAALENMKLKLKDAEELKRKLDEAKARVNAAEAENQQLRRMVKEADDQNIEIRNDMQRLNDIYYAERGKLTECQQLVSRLEQELSGVKLEKEFFAKEAAKVPELKSAVKTGKSQIAALKKSIEDEKVVTEQKIAEHQKKCANLEKLNEESGKHLFNVTEILTNTQAKVRDLEDEAVAAAAKLAAMTTAKAQATDRWLMSAEDLRLQVQRLPEAVNHYDERISVLKSELQKTKLLATSKSNEVFLLQSESKKVQEKLELGSQAYTTQIAALQDNVRELSAKNAEMAKSNASSKQKLSSKTLECEQLNKDIAELKQNLKQLNYTAQQKELESSATIKGLSLQCEDVTFKLESLMAQHEALQQQVKAEQAKHWEEIKQLKDSEAMLLEECDRLNQEVHEKTVALHAVESESTSKESNMRQEVNSTAQMVGTLRDELERRLKDLVQLREERDALQGEKNDLTEAVESLRAEVSKNDNLFKRTLEAERAKMKQELQNRTARIRSLENEKQELLSETQGLMAQVTDSIKETTALQARYDEIKSIKDTLQEQLDVVKSHNNQLLDDLKTADRTQEELREFSDRQQAQHRETVERMEMMLRESKKSASQTVVEMSQNLKQMSAEYDALQREHEKAIENEKRAQSDTERVRTELSNAQLAYQEKEHQLNNEISNLRREVQEHRSKAKIVMESKTRLEMELINLRSDMGKMEMEAHKQSVTIKESESSQKALEESLEATKAQLTTANEAIARLKGTVSELEDGVQRKNTTIEGLKEDLAQLEREGLIEIRRLRLQLTSAEHEISELRPMIPLLQKEAADNKAQVVKLQSNQTGKVNDLLEEVRRAEENLARERKKAATEVESCHSRIGELQVQLEKTRELLEEATAKARAERSERDLKVMQLEGEVERARSTAASKDGRIEELVQQHHLDRVKIHELHEKTSSFDTEMASLKSALSHEQAHRQRLEARLRSLMSTPDFAAEGLNGNTGFLSARGHSSSGTRKSGAFNSTNTAYPNHGSGSHDAWEEDGQDDDMGHSVGGNTHMSHGAQSASSHYSGNTQAYGAGGGNNGGGNKVAYHNIENYGSGNHGGGDPFSYSSSGNNNTGVRAQSPFANAARGLDFNGPSHQQRGDRDRDRGDASVRSSRADYSNSGQYQQSDRSSGYDRYDPNLRSPTNNAAGQFTPTKETQRREYGSPRGDRGSDNSSSGASNRHAQSPVVDRVSAALAARAAAESSKSALRQAQQQRNAQMSRHHAGAGATVSPPRAAGGSTGDGSGQGQNQRRPPSAGGSGSRNYGGDQRDSGGVVYGGAAYAQGGGSSGAGGGGGGNASDNVSQSAAEAIRRTQQMLNRRGISGTVDVGASSSGGERGAAAENTERTPTSGRGAAKLSESIQQANTLYPPSPQRRADPNRPHSSEEDYSYHESANYLDTPAPRPLSPPSLRGGNRPTSGDSADGGAAYDSDGDSVGDLGGGVGHQRSYASVAPLDGGSGGAGAGGGGSKKAKKGVSKKSSGDSGKNYGGLEEALQLPKIAASSTTSRRK